MIIFENPGEIDVAAISTFGVSVKEGDSPIGFFGTGLKYALAILLREQHRVTIWSGLQRFDFGVEPTIIRGKPFDLVTMNGERLGFTTDVGKTWKMWMAYRELFCNARDENGEAYSGKNEIEPEVGKTFVVVSGDEFSGIHGSRWQYFVEDEPDMKIDEMEIWTRPSLGLFYRGVRVAEFSRQAMFTYNDTRKLDLTEDRTVKDHYQIGYRIVRAILKSMDEKLLRRALTATEDWFEHHLDYHGWSVPASPAFLKVVGQLVNSGVKDINKSAKQVWRDANPEEFHPTELIMTEVQRKTLSRALHFCGRIGFDVEGTYPIVVVQSLGTDILGQALDGKIYIAERAFHLGGTKQVASTLIEEFIHLMHGYEDCTHEMQNYLFEKMVSMGEELIGEPA